MRILFAASPAIAVPSLLALQELELENKEITLAGVLTNPDRSQGRHKTLLPTDVSSAALDLNPLREKNGLPFLTQLKPEKLDEKARDEVAAIKPDLLVSFAYGRFFGPRFLSLFPSGGINIHPSLLPKYRGASPIPAVILAMEKETGICIQKIAAELDSGDIVSKVEFKLSMQETTLSLSEDVSKKAAFLLKETLLNFSQKTEKALRQDGTPTYCGEIKKESGLIDWTKSSSLIDAQIRAYIPWPLSYTYIGKDLLFILKAEPVEFSSVEFSSLKVKELEKLENVVPGQVLGVDNKKGILIQTGDGVLAVSVLQKQAKKALDWKVFCNGERNFIGSKLGL